MGGRIGRHTIVASALLSLGASSLVGRTDVNGRWDCHYLRFGQEVEAERVDLRSDGTRVTGTLSGWKLDGTIENDLLRLTATRLNVNESATYEGRVRGDEIDGTVLYRGEEYGWKARRAMEATGPPQTHVFEPTEFHRVRLNRDSAGSHNRIVPSAVQPRYYRDSKFDDHMGIGWKVDRETGVGMLAGPTPVRR